MRELTESDSEAVRTLYYPVIRSPFAIAFQAPLTELAIVFQLNDPSISAWCFRYLISHWPVASSRKQLLFLSQVQSILVMMPPSSSPQIECELIRELKTSIASPNHFVAATALEICKSDVVKRLWWDMFRKELLEVVNEARNHWYPEIRESATRVSNSFARDETVAYDEVKREDSGLVWNVLKNIEPRAACAGHVLLVE
jgi:hypothetical protein